MKRQFFIAGVQFRPRQEIDQAARDMLAGDTLTLQSEPTNKFDPNAVQILYEPADSLPMFLGYVPKKFSSEVAAMLEIGAPISCSVDEVNPAAKTYEMFKVTVSLPIDDFEDAGADVGDGPDFDEGCREE